jgi:osmotically-inducible protein OsmY
MEWEPKVRSTDIGVAAKDGVITLAGFVDTYHEKLEAEHAAKRVSGVKGVANDLEVRLAAGRKRPDPEIARAVVRSLEALDTVPHDRIQVTVRDGWVTLEGKVDWQFQKEAADTAVRYLAGIKGISDLITLTPKISVAAVKHQIEEALRRSAEVDAHRIRVETADSTVVLRGDVRSWTEREEAEAAAWRAPGVTKVENHVGVVP